MFLEESMRTAGNPTGRMHAMEQPTQLTHLGTDGTSGKEGSPSIYATDDGRYVVQGYKLISDEARGQLVHFPPDREDAVIVTPELIRMIKALP
jgi:hypothetical protein